MHDTSWSGGEGCGFATETAEAPLSWEEALIHQFGAKPRGIQPSMSFGYLRPTMDSVKKCSLKRAIKRAARDGTCWYKGKCYTLSDLQPAHVPSPVADSRTYVMPPTPPSMHDQTTCNARHQNRRYLRYLCWNGGGMSQHRLDELKIWCQGQCIDILILTETRWRFSNEWSDAN